jgi:hypothetical protein
VKVDGDCTVTGSITADYCDGLSWRIDEYYEHVTLGDVFLETKCSGTVSGRSYTDSCDWTLDGGLVRKYKLYIGGELKDSGDISCPAPPPEEEVVPPPCTGSLSITTDTCTPTATITATNCDGLTWEFYKAEDYKRYYHSGTVTGDDYTTSFSFSVIQQAYDTTRTFTLVIGGEEKDTASSTCPGAPAPEFTFTLSLNPDSGTGISGWR